MKHVLGNGDACQEERKEMEHLFATWLSVSITAAISDFIPNVSFLTTLQGKKTVFKDLRDDALRLVGKMVELENHKERAKKREDDEHYVPDFVDMISAEPLDNGKPLPDTTLTLIVMVRLRRPLQIYVPFLKLFINAC